jgi:hypothetical protein
MWCNGWLVVHLDQASSADGTLDLKWCRGAQHWRGIWSRCGRSAGDSRDCHKMRVLCSPGPGQAQVSPGCSADVAEMSVVQPRLQQRPWHQNQCQRQFCCAAAPPGVTALKFYEERGQSGWTGRVGAGSSIARIGTYQAAQHFGRSSAAKSECARWSEWLRIFQLQNLEEHFP